MKWFSEVHLNTDHWKCLKPLSERVLSTLPGWDRCLFECVVTSRWASHDGIINPLGSPVCVQTEQLQAASDRKQEERIQSWPSTRASPHQVFSDLVAPLNSATVKDENVEHCLKNWQTVCALVTACLERVAVEHVESILSHFFFRRRVVEKRTTQQSKRWNKRVNERQRLDRHRSLPHQQRYITSLPFWKGSWGAAERNEESRKAQRNQRKREAETRTDGQTKQLIGSWTSL